MRRYIVDIKAYFWAENDLDVIQQAKIFADKWDIKEDNQAEVIEIVEQSFGTVGNRPVLIKDNQ